MHRLVVFQAIYGWRDGFDRETVGLRELANLGFALGEASGRAQLEWFVLGGFD